MRRSPARCLTYAACVAGLLAGTTAGATPVFAGAPWPAYHADDQHTGRSAVTGPRLLTLAWYVAAGDTIDSSPAVAADGSVYVSTGDGRVLAVNPDGSQRWSHRSGARIEASPVLGPDGSVLIGNTAGTIRALSAADGSAIWTLTNQGSIRGTALVLPDGRSYFGTAGGAVIGVDHLGKVLFRTPSGGDVTGAPASGAQGELYWGALDGRLRRMTAGGDVSWDIALDGPIAVAPAVGGDGTVYVAAGQSLLAIDPAAAAVRWRVGAGSTVTTTPAIAADGTIYTGTEGGALLAVRPSGVVRWQYRTGGAIHSAPAADAGGTVYFGSGDGNVYALDQDGKLLSSYHALDAVHGAVAIGADGTIYAGARDKRLYALRADARALTGAPADRIGGALVRDPRSDRVFVLVDGLRRHIPDPETLETLGLAGPVPVALNLEELARYPEGPALPHIGAGTLLAAPNGPIYVITAGRRRWIHSLDEFAGAGYSWEAIVHGDERLVRSVALSIEDGMLVRGPGDRVYLLEGGRRRWVRSLAAFVAARYAWDSVHAVSEATLASMPDGDPIG